jgi:hypothetical protein
MWIWSSGLNRIGGGIQTDLHADLFHLIYILIHFFVGQWKAFYAVSLAENVTVSQYQLNICFVSFFYLWTDFIITSPE